MEHLLNPEQLEAVRHVEGPILLIAGAGSGKTRTLTYRIAHLLEMGIPAAHILAVTFTNKAADEMRERILRLSQVAILASTFHSLCARILREAIAPLGFSTSFSIFDEEDSEKVLREILPDKESLKKMRNGISHAKNQLLSPEDIAKEEKELADIYKQYQQKLKEYNALDFDDLLYQTVRLFQNNHQILEKFQNCWSFLLIDEYQDTNAAQYLLTKLLAQRHQNVFAVGDPDQSIYSWRGASVQNILQFPEDYPGAKILTLSQNYRSTGHILAAANGLISHNKNRYEKELWSAREKGSKVHVHICQNDKEEVTFVIEQLLKYRRMELPLSECVIFYRTHFQSRLFEDALLRHRIPYQIIGGVSFYMRREVKDLLAYLRMACEGRNLLSFVRTINIPKRGIGKVTIEKLRKVSEDHKMDIFSVCQQVIEGKISCSLSQKQLEGLRDYVEVITTLRAMIAEGVAISELLNETILATNFIECLQEDPETFEERQENTQELISIAVDWEAQRGSSDLIDFLEDLSLRSPSNQSSSEDHLRLMTLHNGKGLEFTLCFLVGMEEELFPHINALEDPNAIEEERRIAYVGITRAKDHLYLSAARLRMLWGTVRPMQPSRFLFELPAEHVNSKNALLPRETQQSAEGSIHVGDEVVHRDLGQGIVQKSYATSFGETYDVFFPRLGVTRSLVAKFAKLERVGKRD